MADTIDGYIAQFKDKTTVYALLNSMREIIKNAAPEAAEKISWQMPTFTLNGILVQFAAFNNHMSLFPGPDAIEAFKQDLAGYKTSKGTIQFPYSPLPCSLIKQIVECKIVLNRNKGKR